MNLKYAFSPLVILLTALLLLVSTLPVFAHGSTTVGDYKLEIGFKIEPALQGELNGLDLIVTNTKTNQPVTGLEQTLKAEIIFGASKKTLELEPVEGEEGAYTAAILPTAVGDYTWHIFGAIEDTPVDISMTSSPTTFVSVVPKSEASFPASEPDASALAAVQAQANQRAMVGIVTSIVALLVAILSLVVALTRNARRG
jgi:hypothetical protein